MDGEERGAGGLEPPRERDARRRVHAAAAVGQHAHLDEDRYAEAPCERLDDGYDEVRLVEEEGAVVAAPRPMPCGQPQLRSIASTRDCTSRAAASSVCGSSPQNWQTSGRSVACSSKFSSR